MPPVDPRAEVGAPIILCHAVIVMNFQKWKFGVIGNGKTIFKKI